MCGLLFKWLSISGSSAKACLLSISIDISLIVELILPFNNYKLSDKSTALSGNSHLIK